jgi:hypothetical protein
VNRPLPILSRFGLMALNCGQVGYFNISIPSFKKLADTAT